jgi:large subunit ribosomal protein L24
MKKFKIKQGDTVVVNTGKDAGKKGQISQMIPKKEKVLIDGVNMVKKHKRSQSENKKPNIMEEPAPIHVSNVMYYCSKCDRGVRLGIKVQEDGTKSRYCKKCGTTIK